MNEELSKKLARNRAEQIVKEMGITSLPIDPFKIASKYDIICESKILNGCIGSLVKVGETFGILYSSNLLVEGLVNFTVGHELGHYFIPGHPEKLFPNGSGIHKSGNEFSSKDIVEVEADHFSAGLLMPEDLFKEEILKADDNGFPAIERLSKTCKTSLTATAIRYSEYADYPLAIIVSTGKQIDFCFMSEPLKDLKSFTWIRKGDLLPLNSATFKFNKDPDNVRMGKTDEGESFLDQWFNGAPSIEFCEDIVGLGKYGKTMTALFCLDPLAPDQVEEDVRFR